MHLADKYEAGTAVDGNLVSKNILIRTPVEIMKLLKNHAQNHSAWGGDETVILYDQLTRVCQFDQYNTAAKPVSNKRKRAPVYYNLAELAEVLWKVGASDINVVETGSVSFCTCAVK